MTEVEKVNTRITSLAFCTPGVKVLEYCLVKSSVCFVTCTSEELLNLLGSGSLSGLAEEELEDVLGRREDAAAAGRESRAGMYDLSDPMVQVRVCIGLKETLPKDMYKTQTTYTHTHTHTHAHKYTWCCFRTRFAHGLPLVMVRQVALLLCRVLWRVTRNERRSRLPVALLSILT